MKRWKLVSQGIVSYFQTEDGVTEEEIENILEIMFKDTEENNYYCYEDLSCKKQNVDFTICVGGEVRFSDLDPKPQEEIKEYEFENKILVRYSFPQSTGFVIVKLKEEEVDAFQIYDAIKYYIQINYKIFELDELKVEYEEYYGEFEEELVI